MRYLHNSDIKVHGRLRSSQCVVDSRFMLKIKGFGPKCFTELENKIIDEISVNYSSKFLLVCTHKLTRTGMASKHTHRRTRVFSKRFFIYKFNTEISGNATITEHSPPTFPTPLPSPKGTRQGPNKTHEMTTQNSTLPST